MLRYISVSVIRLGLLNTSKKYFSLTAWSHKTVMFTPFPDPY